MIICFGKFVAITLLELALLWIYSFLLVLVAISARYFAFHEYEMNCCMWFALPECVYVFACICIF